MEAIQMKTDVRMISLLLAATALTSGPLLAAPSVARPSDGQAQAAALLSQEWTPVATDTRRVAATLAPRIDAHARAAALLSRPQTESTPAPMSRLSQAMPEDGQARAAALLSPRAM
jgi:hypothetical protein